MGTYAGMGGMGDVAIVWQDAHGKGPCDGLMTAKIQKTASSSSARETVPSYFEPDRLAFLKEIAEELEGVSGSIYGKFAKSIAVDVVRNFGR